MCNFAEGHNMYTLEAANIDRIQLNFRYCLCFKGTVPPHSEVRISRLTQGPLMSSCKHFMMFQQLADDVIIVKLIVTSSCYKVSGPCAQLNHVDTPNSLNLGLQ